LSETPYLKRKEFLAELRRLRQEIAILKAGGGGGSGTTSTFLELQDTPTAYTGAAGAMVKVKPAQDGLAFDQVIDGGDYNE